MITSSATARLMAEIVSGRLNTPERTRRMMDLLRRDPFSPGDPEDQARGFSGIALIERKLTDARLWSKAGWTSKVRHDVAYIETPDGKRVVIAILTENHASVRGFIPAVVGRLLDGLREEEAAK
jgi:hypothetical protein